jgi:hypothetical protein
MVWVRIMKATPAPGITRQQWHDERDNNVMPLLVKQAGFIPGSATFSGSAAEIKSETHWTGEKELDDANKVLLPFDKALFTKGLITAPATITKYEL